MEIEKLINCIKYSIGKKEVCYSVNCEAFICNDIEKEIIRILKSIEWKKYPEIKPDKTGRYEVVIAPINLDGRIEIENVHASTGVYSFRKESFASSGKVFYWREKQDLPEIE
jgi:hypothetical protein